MFLFAFWLLAALHMDLVRYCFALRLYPCESSGYHEVVENTSATFYCDQYSGSVEWRYNAPGSPTAVRHSTCDATHCTRTVFNAFTATFISAGNSSFTTTLTSRDITISGGEYGCQDKGCRVHIIVPAVISKPTGTITRTDRGYSARCNTDVTKVYSSRGHYSCVWQMGPETRSGTLNLQPPPSDTSNTSDRTGSCDVTLPLPNNTYRCSVTLNPGNTQKSSDSIQNDPPPSPPQISGYVINRILYQGDNLTLTCSVTGGDPVVASVTLNCPGQHDNSPNPGQSSSLMITSLRADDNNLRCICSGQWVRPSYYTLTDSRTLRVYYPPSTPVIQRTDGSSFPFMETDNVTLTCTVTSPGNPEATLSWSVSKATNDRLQLTSVGKGDNLRNITCRAANAFTQHKGRELLDVFALHVYYGPYVSLTSLEGNDCAMISNLPLCVVKENQRVHVQAKADSNPAQRPYAWQAPPGSDLDLGTRGDLDISSINRNDSGVYQVVVETEKPDANDTRLPLTAKRNLTVLVTYPSSRVTLVIDGSNNRTVNENDSVIFECQSNGRPTPELQLTQSDTVLLRAEGGKLSLSEASTRLTHTITAQCNNTGLYTCSAHNGLGDTRDTAQLYVNCSPRPQQPAPTDPFELNYEGGPVQLSVDMVAFPLPDTFTFVFNGPGNNVSQPVTHGKLHVHCSNMFAAYTVTCNITVNAITSKETGFYSVRIGNSVGYSTVIFEVIYFETDPQARESTSGGLSSGAAVGVTLVLMFVVVGVVVVWLWRRHWVLPCASSSANESNNTEFNQSAVSVEREEQQNAKSNEMQASNNYESLRLQDIGLRSDYAEISLHVNAGMNPTNGAGPLVFNTRRGRLYENVEDSSMT